MKNLCFNVAAALSAVIAGASIIVTVLGVIRRGWRGFGLGLLSIVGAALSFSLMFGVAVLFEPGGPLQSDSIALNGIGLVGVILFGFAARLALHRKSVSSGVNE